MNCPTCGHANPDGSKFCRGCGGSLGIAPSAAVGWECARCHHTNRDGTRFCAGCGTTAGDASAPPSPALDPAVAASLAHPITTPLTSDQGPNATLDVAEVSPVCPHCGAFHQPGVRFCKACGQTVETHVKVENPAAAPVAVTASHSTTPILEPSPVLSAKHAARGETSAPRPTHEERPAASVNTPTQAANAPPTGAPLAPKPRSGRGKTIAIASAIVVLVAGIGTLVAWKLLQHDTTTTEASAPLAPASSSGALTQTSPSSASSIAPPAITPIAAVEPKPAENATALTSTHTMATSAPKQAEPAAVPASASSIVVLAPAPSTPTRASEPPPPPPRKVQASMPAAGPSMQQVALKLVRQGEQAFGEQNYSTAIANAKAALEMQPGNARASHLLQEAQQGQQNAMNSISIH